MYLEIEIQVTDKPPWLKISFVKTPGMVYIHTLPRDKGFE